MTGFCSLVGSSKLTCGESLQRRPIGPLVDSLKELGVDCWCDGGYPPVEIKKGGIKGGKTTLPGDVSSQFLSSLLLVSPFARKTIIGLTTPLQSEPYVLMTLKMQKRFGVEIETSGMAYLIEGQNYSPATVRIEGDWSSASFLLAAGALAGEVEIGDLNLASFQGDRSILDLLKRMGAEIEAEVHVEKTRLKRIDVNLSNCPDLFPVVCVLSAGAEGVSRITGIDRLKIKESNRIEAMKDGLGKMGVRMEERGGEVLIEGGSPSGGEIDPQKDHRIAMAFAVLGLIAKGKTVIKDAECVSKSFPDFWDVLKKLNCEVVYE
jgi:3-phosphoshikimate 1-carboxyvinyltransferase